MKRGKCVNKEKRKGNGKLILAFIVILVLLASIPFVIDYLYRSGVLSRYHNGFKADTWFGFIGSYFPSSILGLLALYQTHIISKTSEKYQALQNRHRYAIRKNINLYAYDTNRKMVALYDREEIFNKINGALRKKFLEHPEWGYIINLSIWDIQTMGIEAIEIENLYLRAGKREIKVIPAILDKKWDDIVAGNQECIITLFFYVCDNAGQKEIERYITNYYRGDKRYNLLKMEANFDVIIDSEANVKGKIKIKANMQAGKNTYILTSVNENCWYSEEE